MEYLAGATGRHMVPCIGQQLGSRGREEGDKCSYTSRVQQETKIREDFKITEIGAFF